MGGHRPTPSLGRICLSRVLRFTQLMGQSLQCAPGMVLGSHIVPVLVFFCDSERQGNFFLGSHGAWQSWVHREAEIKLIHAPLEDALPCRGH